ncbi:MAG: hypothetical protein JXA73_22950 [Acidobacteria bacterium]|nr:hypothetical protein [Acidobacteriota bacterium]
MSKSEEKQQVEILKKAYMTVHPNPERKDCPEPKVLRDVAFHRNIGTQEQFEAIMDHLTQCSACVRDHMAFVEEYKEEKRWNQQIMRALLGLAAVLVISLAIWAVWRTQPKQELAIQPPEPKHQESANPAAPDTSNHENIPPQIAQLESVTIEIPPKLRGSAENEHPIILSRGRLNIEIRMPIGSPEGRYKLRILDNSGKAHSAVERTASKVNGITSVRSTLDTSNLPPGDYKFSIQESGFEEWTDYPLLIN